MINFFKKKKGSAILIIVFLTIIVFFSVAVTITDIIQVNLALSKNQFNSTSAYFAAEVGLEEALWNVMKDEYELPEVDSLNVFSSHANSSGGVRDFLNSSQYQVNYDREASLRIFTSLGSDLGARRAAQVRFCLPDCEFKKCGEDDGCGILCPSKCITNPGCLADPITDTNAEVVPGSEGYCCEMGGVAQACYQCKESYAWDGDSCEYICEQDCTGLGCGELDPICNKPCPSACPSYPGCSATEPDGAEEMPDSDGFCCGGETCYTCDATHQWDGTECKPCDPKFNTTYDEGDCETPSECRNCGVWDCDGLEEIPADSQPVCGSPCVGGVKPTVYLKMDENTGLKAYDSSSNNDGNFNGGYWQYRKKITVDYRKVAADLINFPLLVQRTDDNDLKTYAAISGNDILFRDSNGVKLDHEIESFNKAKGDLTAWVKIPLLSNTEDTVIYMYYGNLSAANQQNPSGVWDSAYRGVWHLSDRTSSINDSTSYNNDGTTSALLSQTGVASSSQYFNSGTATNIGSQSNLSLTGNLEISAWIKTPKWVFDTPVSLSGWRGIFGSNYSLPNYFGYAFALNNATTSSIGFFSSTVGTWVSSNARENFLNDGNWHHVAVSLENNTATFYVDGQVEGIKLSARPESWNGTRYLGYAQSLSGGFYGNLEEIRVSANKRDTAWFKTSHDNQKNLDFLTVSGREEMTASANWTGGRYGSAISFDGTDDYMNIPDSANLDAMTRLTVSAWVKLPVGYSDASDKVLVQKRNNLGLGYGLYNNANSQGPSLRIQSSTIGTLTNIAQGKPATQSSTYYWSGNPIPATNAVDNTVASFNHTLANTAGGEWLMIDLGKSSIISRFQLVKRGDCCYLRPNTYQIQVSENTTFASASIKVNQTVQSCNSSNCVMTHDITPASGRYVRVLNTAPLNTDAAYLNIAEFRIYGPEINLYANQNIADGNWHHVAGTYDGTTMRIYVDGALRNSTGYTGAVVANNSPLRVGASDAPGQYFSGLVDEVKVYNYARTATDVTNDMSEKVCNGTGSCVALTSFNVNSASSQSCDDICWQAGQKCVSVGTDTSATNGLMRIYNNGSCDNAAANCASTMTKLPNTGMSFYCGGRQTNWTNCQCSLCVSNFGEACGGNDCIVPGSGKIDCEGNCVSPTYEPAGKACGDPDLDYMQCDGIGNCRSLCHPLVDKDCKGEPCVDPGKTNCAGVCIGARTLDDGDNCISMSSAECWDCAAISDPDAQAYCQTHKLSATKYCYSCAPNYRNICNNELECVVRGTIDCFGNCPYDSYNFTPRHTATRPSLCDSSDEEGIEEGSGWCDGAGVCTECTPEYMALYNEDEGNNQHCNDQNECHIWGTIDCETGTECSEDGWYDDSRDCNSGEGVNSGYCRPDNGECQECAQAYMDLYDPVVGAAPACNTDECHIPGTIKCDTGECTTLNLMVSDGTVCDYDNNNILGDGYCSAGVCVPCESNEGDECAPCKDDPSQDCPPRECVLSGNYSCAGKCSYPIIIPAIPYLDPSRWCNAGVPAAASINPKNTGKCDGVGNCIPCEPGYLSGLGCTNVPGDPSCYTKLGIYDCQDKCYDYTYKTAHSVCDAGYPTSPRHPNTGTCNATGVCNDCDAKYISGEACNDTECHVPGTYNCPGICSKGPNDHIAAGTLCDAGTGSNTGQCTFNSLTLEMECKRCDERYFTGEKCPPYGETVCWSTLGTYSCAGVCVGGTKVVTGGICNNGTVCRYPTTTSPVTSCECNDSAVCTNPLENVSILNLRTNTSCDAICRGIYQPTIYKYNKRSCTAVSYNNNFAWYYNTYTARNWWGGCEAQTAYCGSSMSAPNSPYNVCNGSTQVNQTYCNCHRCADTWGDQCQWETDSNTSTLDCNINSSIDCNGNCTWSYTNYTYPWSNYSNTTVYSCNYNGTNNYSGYCTTNTTGQRTCNACVAASQPFPRYCNNTSPCLNQGVINCAGSCMVGSTDCTNPDLNPTVCYKARTTPCTFTTGSLGQCTGPSAWTIDGVTYPRGTCADCVDSYNSNCDIVSPYDSECYSPGYHLCDGTCFGAGVKANQYNPATRIGTICTTHPTIINSGPEGRCWEGTCVACDAQYLSGQLCPFPVTAASPAPQYQSNCYDRGKYDCFGYPNTAGHFLTQAPWSIWYGDPMACITNGVYQQGVIINQGKLCDLGTPQSPYWLCTDGKCANKPDHFAVLNSASNRSCSNVCTNDYQGYRCEDVGYDAAGTNNVAYVLSVNSKGDKVCDSQLATCDSIMSNANLLYCNGANTSWTWCLCGKCDSRFDQNCTESQFAATNTYNPPNYDSECYNFGKFDCAGLCRTNFVTNTGGVCRIDTGQGLANEGDEGRCVSDGTCSRCHPDFVNNVPCSSTFDTCKAQVRQCSDGTCIPVSQLAIGADCTSTTCISNCQCDSSGTCVPASSLPNIVVPNTASNQSCQSICSGYTGRQCASVGNDANATNGYGSYYGISDEAPYCFKTDAATCATIMQRSPGNPADANYGFLCETKYTNWTNCRCSYVNP